MPGMLDKVVGLDPTTGSQESLDLVGLAVVGSSLEGAPRGAPYLTNGVEAALPSSVNIQAYAAPLSFQPAADSATAFILKNAAGADILTLDTLSPALLISCQVGIGTVSPTAGFQMHVTGGARFETAGNNLGVNVFRVAAAEGLFRSHPTLGLVEFGSLTANDVSFISNGTPRMSLMSTGELMVGGSAAPGGNLDVRPQATGQVIVWIQQAFGQTANMTSWMKDNGIEVFASVAADGQVRCGAIGTVPIGYPGSLAVRVDEANGSFGAGVTTLSLVNEFATPPFVRMDFAGKDSIAGIVSFGRIAAQILDQTTGSVDTDLVFGPVVASVIVERLRLTANGGMIIPVLAAEPSAPTDGSVWYNSVEARIKTRQASSTVSIGNWTNTTTQVELAAVANTVAIGGSPPVAAKFHVEGTSNIITVSVRGDAAQTAPLFKLMDSADNVWVQVGPDGAVVFDGTTFKSSIGDNLASAFVLKQGADNYFELTTTNGFEKLAFGNATTNPDADFLGTGTLTCDLAAVFSNYAQIDDLRTPRVAPASIGANQNDYAGMNGFSYAELAASTPVNITGITAGVDGRHLWIVNTSANTITLTNEDILSAAANRIHSAGGGNIALIQDASTHLVYSAGLSRWREIA